MQFICLFIVLYFFCYHLVPLYSPLPEIITLLSMSVSPFSFKQGVCGGEVRGRADWAKKGENLFNLN